MKATGDGIRADLRKVIVSAPDRPAALVEWPGYGGPGPSWWISKLGRTMRLRWPYCRTNRSTSALSTPARY